jgi:phage shock protein PspC (stress-responsive transcriptional regulator)
MMKNEKVMFISITAVCWGLAVFFGIWPLLIAWVLVIYTYAKMRGD